MRYAITGSRGFTDAEKVNAELLARLRKGDELVLGDAAGVDRLAWLFAVLHEVPHTVKEADWSKYGRAAGPIRNGQMLDEADELIAFTAGAGPGTANCIAQAQARGMVVHRVD